MIEKKIQDIILKDLRSYGKYCECFKIIKSSDSGELDIFFTTKITGAVFIEVKKPGEVPSKLQEYKIKKLNDCGSKAFSCDSIDSWNNIKISLGLNILDFNK
jgi:hypothetical protein